MKKVLVVLVAVFVALSVSKPMFAAAKTEAAAPGNIKIAVVDLGRALNEVEEGKKAKANLEKEFKSKKTELDTVKNQITALRDDLEKKSNLLSQEAMKQKQDEYQKKFMEYQQKANDYTKELAQKENEMSGKIIGKLRGVVEKMAQDAGYTFVFEKSQGGVVYGPASADITNDVIKNYK